MINQHKITLILIGIFILNRALANTTKPAGNNNEYLITLRDESLSHTDKLRPGNHSSGYDFYFYKTLENVYKNVKLVREIYIYFGTFITALGSILNALCIIVFYRSKIFRNSSFPYYVYVISVVDTLNIFMRFAVPQLNERMVRNTLFEKYNVNPHELNQEDYDKYTSRITSEYRCSIFIYIYNSLTLVSVWLMVAVSLERLLVIKFALQTKYMIKLRAFFILFFIFFAIFSLNIFDLTPGLYIKPQWYANLTLLCERDDAQYTLSNKSSIYKRFGPLTFNTETFAFSRTIFQSLVPFLAVLIFNSLIIYNFKRIKLAAVGRGKSNSCVSVNSYSGNLSMSAHRNRNNFKRRNTNSITKQNRSQLQIPKRSAIEFTLGGSSSRSPSPFFNLSAPNTPLTPTSLVSTLNLVPTNESNLTQKSNLFLMPPYHMNGSVTPSMGTTNSSANLSVATSTNLTATTCVNQQQSSLSNGGGCSSNEKLSFMITSVLPSNKKHVTTITTATGSRVSFKRRVNKIRLNRETDIMLIVLSFSILISQLPCTIAWYLIYYRSILKSELYDVAPSVYFFASTPIVLYSIRLLEMCYFSLNFFFYITLSPSLRRELKKDLPKKFQFFSNLMFKCSRNTNIINAGLDEKNNKTEINQNDNLKSSQTMAKSCQKRVYSNSSGDYTDYIGKMRSVSPLRRPNYLIGQKDTKVKSEQAESSMAKNKIYFGKYLKNSLRNKKKQALANQKSNYNNHLIASSNKIKIIIDNLYDEEEELKIDDDLILDQNDQSNNTLSNNKRFFNQSSPSFLNSFNQTKADERKELPRNVAYV